MIAGLTRDQFRRWEEFRDFADLEIVPTADERDHSELFSPETILKLGNAGYLGAILPADYGGHEMDPVVYGLLAEELGRACASVRNFVAVQDMVAQSIYRWGREEQRARWLPRLCNGQSIAGFALTEPEIGSDAAGILCRAEQTADGFVLTGQKKWVSFGQIADLFLVFAKINELGTAFIIPRTTPGLVVRPIKNLLGFRASMLAEIDFEGCTVPRSSILGGPGVGISVVAASALDLGRYSAGWAAVGIAQACLVAAASYAVNRKQGGYPVATHQLIGQLLSQVSSSVIAARLTCLNAGRLRAEGRSEATSATLLCKYLGAKVANQAANAAVQIHGAMGLSSSGAISRHFRDARVLEVVEGTTQIHENLIGAEVARVANRSLPDSSPYSTGGILTPWLAPTQNSDGRR